MPRGVILLFAIASGASVANVYYAQPLLDILARDFNVSHAAIGGVVTATQIGCALALIFLVPLGDLVNRRRLMALQLIALISALLVVGFAHSTIILLAGMLAVGLLGTAMTQGLIAYAASTAAPHEQGHVVGTAQSGVFIGLLLARVFSGGISDVAGWRGVYFCAALIMLMIALPPLETSASFKYSTQCHALPAASSLDVKTTTPRKSAPSARCVSFTHVRGI